MSDTRELRFATISDIHLGHKRTKTQFIVNNLNKHLVTDEFLASIDILFIVGDLYDEQLSTYSDEYQQVGTWLARLLRKCHRYGVIVRLLEGTRSHDRYQGVQLVTMNEAYKKANKGVEDLRYIDSLEIEYIAKWNIWVLYVPDDLPGTPYDTLDRVRELMREKGIKHVDLAMMHGVFSYQLPEMLAGQVPFHSEEEYAKIVSRLVFIGHHHNATNYGKIYAQGSFDRLSHGEENPKGFYRVVMSEDSYTVTFIENTDAQIYKSIACDQDSVTENLMKIDEEVKSIPSGAYLRIVAKQGNPIFENMSLVKERWPGYNWTNSVVDKEKARTKPILDHKQVYVPVMLDRDTLKPTLLSRLALRGYAPALLERCAEQLNTITAGR